ncbi:MAG: hypothetical protein WD334_01655 [Chitinophagales bacterium]
MKRSCRQTLLFVVLSLFITTMANAAEAKLKSQNQLDQDTWAATYEVVSWNSSNYNLEDSEVKDQRIPSELKTLVSYIETFEGVSRVTFDKATGLITIVSNREIDLPSTIEK